MKFGSRDLLFPVPQVRRLNPLCHLEDRIADQAHHGVAKFLAESICRGTSGDSYSHGKFVRGSADREREVHERRHWAGHGHTQRRCSHRYDDHDAGGVGPEHGELFRHHELRNQFGFADSGRAMRLLARQLRRLSPEGPKGAKGPFASV